MDFEERLEAGKTTRVFLCRFVGKSHLHNAWLPERRMRRIAEAKMRNFLEKRLEKDEDDLAQDQEKYMEWEKVERIIDKKCVVVFFLLWSVMLYIDGD